MESHSKQNSGLIEPWETEVANGQTLISAVQQLAEQKQLLSGEVKLSHRSGAKIEGTQLPAYVLSDQGKALVQILLDPSIKDNVRDIFFYKDGYGNLQRNPYRVMNRNYYDRVTDLNDSPSTDAIHEQAKPNAKTIYEELSISPLQSAALTPQDRIAEMSQKQSKVRDFIEAIYSDLNVPENRSNSFAKSMIAEEIYTAIEQELSAPIEKQELVNKIAKSTHEYVKKNPDLFKSRTTGKYIPIYNPKQDTLTKTGKRLVDGIFNVSNLKQIEQLFIFEENGERYRYTLRAGRAEDHGIIHSKLDLREDNKLTEFIDQIFTELRIIDSPNAYKVKQAVVTEILYRLDPNGELLTHSDARESVAPHQPVTLSLITRDPLAPAVIPPDLKDAELIDTPPNLPILAQPLLPAANLTLGSGEVGSEPNIEDTQPHIAINEPAIKSDDTKPNKPVEIIWNEEPDKIPPRKTKQPVVIEGKFVRKIDQPPPPIEPLKTDDEVEIIQEEPIAQTPVMTINFGSRTATPTSTIQSEPEAQKQNEVQEKRKSRMKKALAPIAAAAVVAIVSGVVLVNSLSNRNNQNTDVANNQIVETATLRYNEPTQVAMAEETREPTFTPSPTPTNTITLNPTDTDTSTPIDTVTESATFTPTNSETNTPSETPIPTDTATVVSSATATSSPSFTPSNTPTDTPTPIASPTTIVTSTDTPTDLPTPTAPPVSQATVVSDAYTSFENTDGNNNPNTLPNSEVIQSSRATTITIDNSARFVATRADQLFMPLSDFTARGVDIAINTNLFNSSTPQGLLGAEGSFIYDYPRDVDGSLNPDISRYALIELRDPANLGGLEEHILRDPSGNLVIQGDLAMLNITPWASLSRNQIQEIIQNDVVPNTNWAISGSGYYDSSLSGLNNVSNGYQSGNARTIVGWNANGDIVVSVIQNADMADIISQFNESGIVMGTILDGGTSSQLYYSETNSGSTNLVTPGTDQPNTVAGYFGADTNNDYRPQSESLSWSSPNNVSLDELPPYLREYAGYNAEAKLITSISVYISGLSLQDREQLVNRVVNIESSNNIQYDNLTSIEIAEAIVMFNRGNLDTITPQAALDNYFAAIDNGNTSKIVLDRASVYVNNLYGPLDAMFPQLFGGGQNTIVTADSENRTPVPSNNLISNDQLVTYSSYLDISAQPHENVINNFYYDRELAINILRELNVEDPEAFLNTLEVWDDPTTDTILLGRGGSVGTTIIGINQDGQLEFRAIALDTGSRYATATFYEEIVQMQYWQPLLDLYNSGYLGEYYGIDTPQEFVWFMTEGEGRYFAELPQHISLLNFGISNNSYTYSIGGNTPDSSVNGSMSTLLTQLNTLNFWGEELTVQSFREIVLDAESLRQFDEAFRSTFTDLIPANTGILTIMHGAKVTSSEIVPSPRVNIFQLQPLIQVAGEVLNTNAPSNLNNIVFESFGENSSIRLSYRTNSTSTSETLVNTIDSDTEYYIGGFRRILLAMYLTDNNISINFGNGFSVESILSYSADDNVLYNYYTQINTEEMVTYFQENYGIDLLSGNPDYNLRNGISDAQIDAENLFRLTETFSEWLEEHPEYEDDLDSHFPSGRNYLIQSAAGDLGLDVHSIKYTAYNNQALYSISFSPATIDPAGDQITYTMLIDWNPYEDSTFSIRNKIVPVFENVANHHGTAGNRVAITATWEDIDYNRAANHLNEVFKTEGENFNVPEGTIFFHPTGSPVSQTFGNENDLYESGSHMGLDFAGGELPVIANSTFEVVILGEELQEIENMTDYREKDRRVREIVQLTGMTPNMLLYHYGNSVVIGQTEITFLGRPVYVLYGHGSAYDDNLTKGMIIQGGQRFATTGNEGTSTSDHLHIGFYVFNGNIRVDIDPLDFMPSYYPDRDNYFSLVYAPPELDLIEEQTSVAAAATPVPIGEPEEYVEGIGQ